MSRVILGVLGYVALFGALLLLPGGDFSWLQAWILLATLMVVRLVGDLRVFRINASLARERQRLPIQSGQPLLDRFLLAIFMTTFSGLLAFVSVDHARLHLLPPPPAAIAALGLVVFVAGWALAVHALVVNAFAVTVVRHQQERKHQLVDRGAYRLVRHPMYLGVVAVIFGTGLWLRSTAGLIAALLPACVLIVRITVEERLLTLSLPGYAEYRSQVPYRLVPGLW